MNIEKKRGRFMTLLMDSPLACLWRGHKFYQYVLKNDQVFFAKYCVTCERCLKTKCYPPPAL